MALVYTRALLWLARVLKQAGSGSIGLALGVTAVWLAVFQLVVHTVPPPGQAALASSFYSVGQLAHLHGFSGTRLSVPLELDTFKDLYQALWDDNTYAINEVLSRPGWIHVVEGQAVRIIDVYENGFQVELIDGPNAGRQAWVMLHQLGP